MTVDAVCGPSPVLQAPRFRHLPWITSLRFARGDDVDGGARLGHSTEFNNPVTLTPREMNPLDSHQCPKCGADPDGRWLIVYRIGLQVWDAQGWTLVSSNDFGKINIWVTSTLSVSHDSTRVSCARGFPYAQQERLRLHGAAEEVVELAFSPDGQTIATGGYSNPITLWNVAQTKADTIAVPTQTRNCVLGYSRDGETLVTIDATGRVLRRDPTSLAVLETICRLNVELASIEPSAPDFRVTAMGTTTDIKHMALGMTNGTVEIWDLMSRTNVLLKAHSAPARALAFSPGSNSPITSCPFKTLRSSSFHPMATI